MKAKRKIIGKLEIQFIHNSVHDFWDALERNEGKATATWLKENANVYVRDFEDK